MLTLCCRRRQTTYAGGPSLREKGWKGYLFPDLPGGAAPTDANKKEESTGTTEDRQEGMQVSKKGEIRP